MQQNPKLKPRYFAFANNEAILALLKAQAIIAWQSKSWWLADIASVMLYIMVAKLALGSDTYELQGMPYLAYLAYGLVVATCFLRAFEAAAYIQMDFKMGGLMPDYITPPITAWELLLAWVIGPVINAYSVAIALFITFAIIGLPIAQPSYSGLIGLFLFCWVGASLGHSASLLSQKWDHIVSVDVYIILPIIMLSGVFFAPSQLPLALTYLLDYNPIFWVIDGLRNDFIGDSNNLKSLITASILAPIAFASAVFILNKGWGTKL